MAGEDDELNGLLVPETEAELDDAVIELIGADEVIGAESRIVCEPDRVEAGTPAAVAEAAYARISASPQLTCVRQCPMLERRTQKDMPFDGQ